MKCGFCKREDVDMEHVRRHIRRPSWTEKRDAHHDARRQLIADIRAASAGIEPGRYALDTARLAEVYEVEDGTSRIRQHDGSPLGSLQDELWAYQRIGINPQGAMLAYGQITGLCGHCNEPLPNAAARARGITPICAMEMGWVDVVRASG
jgi:hypothetical protein